MFKKIMGNRIFRFLIFGAITAAFNILMLAFMIEFFKIDKPLLRNVANVISIEISMLFSFFVYRNWVWSRGNWTFQEIWGQQIPLYHLSCGLSVATRSLILFPLLDWLGINYTVNTLLGIVVGSSMNYIVSDKYVFKDK